MNIINVMNVISLKDVNKKSGTRICIKELAFYLNAMYCIYSHVVETLLIFEA